MIWFFSRFDTTTGLPKIQRSVAFEKVTRIFISIIMLLHIVFAFHETPTVLLCANLELSFHSLSQVGQPNVLNDIQQNAVICQGLEEQVN